MSEAKDADVDRLTSQKVERLRIALKLLTDYDSSVNEDDIDALCDLALQSLSQEAVRDEALEEAARVCEAMGGHAERNRDYCMARGEIEPASSFNGGFATAGTCAYAIRALKREPNAAGPCPRCGEGLGTIGCPIEGCPLLATPAPESPEDRETMRRDFERGVYERAEAESETPETDAICSAGFVSPLAAIARSLERRLSLAQTEIKGHMRVEEELKVTAEAERNCRMEAEGVAAKLQRRLRDEEDKYQGALIRADNIKVELDKAQARIAELEKDAARYQTKKHIDCLKFMETSGYKICKDTDSLLIAWSMSYDAAIDAALKDRA